MTDEPAANITVTHQGFFWFVKADGETLGHVGKAVRVEGESAWKSFFRSIFRPLWRASVASGGGFVELDEIHGGVFRDRSEAVGAILAYHGISDPKYPAPSN